jgi:hypothetical protein
MAHDEEEEKEEIILPPEELLSQLLSEERALARIVESPDPRRIANFIEGTIFPLMKDTLRALAAQSAAVEELEDTVYVRSTLQARDAAKIHSFLDKTLSLFDSGAKDMLPVLERDAYASLLGEVRRLVIRAEEDEADDDDEEEGDDADDAAIRNAPEIQPNGQP